MTCGAYCKPFDGGARKSHPSRYRHICGATSPNMIHYSHRSNIPFPNGDDFVTTRTEYERSYSMTRNPAAPPFALPLVFPDVEPEILADEEREAQADVEALPWQAYLRRVLPPHMGDSE
jgi:hypothetical protein